MCRSHLSYAGCAITGWPQCAQRRASSGISLKHSGHFLLVGLAGASPRCIRAIKAFTGVTTKKYTAAVTSKNEMVALTKSPAKKLLLLIVNFSAEKSDLPTRAA